MTSPAAKQWMHQLLTSPMATHIQTAYLVSEERPNSPQNGFQELDQLSTQYEGDSKHAQALANARKRFASNMREIEMPITIAMLRMQQGLAQSKVAALLGNLQSSYSLIESGQCDMLHKTFEKLVDIFQVSRDELAKAIRQTKQLAHEKERAAH